MSEQHDYDKLKQEEADELREKAENDLYNAIKSIIDELNSIIANQDSVLERHERAEYVRDTVNNLIEG